MEINVSDIQVDDAWNCRGPFLLGSIRDLADNIKAHGQLQEVVVQPFDGVGSVKYRLVAGFRRFAAIARILRWKTIRAQVVEVDETGARALNLIENLERQNLNCLQEALAIEAIWPQSRYGCRHVAEVLRRTTEWVLNRRRLLELPEEVQKKVACGQIPLSRIKVLRASSDPEETCNQLLKRKHPRSPLPGLKRRNMREIKELIGRLIDCGLDGLPTQVLAWVNGYVSDEELDREIERMVQEGR